MTYDVCIVGAGPGGLHSAGLLSKEGIKPLVIERNKEETDSICGEMVGKIVLDKVGISEDSDIVCNRVPDARLVNRDTGREIEIPGRISGGGGFLLNEDRFKTYLKDIAISNGTEFKFEEKATSVIKNDGHVTGVRTNKNTYKTPLTVGADGSYSKIAKSAGFPLSDHAAYPSFRYKLKNCKDLDPDMAEFHFSENIGLGYLWLYPRSQTECNVGIGSLQPGNMGVFMKRFISERKELQNAKIIDKNGGKIPYAGLTPKFTDNGVVLVGNSAGQVSNLSGGGVMTTLTGAETSAPVLIDAIESEDFSYQKLSRYEERYKSSRAGNNVESTASYLSRIIDFSEKNDPFSYVDEIMKIVDEEKITETVNGNFSFSFLFSLFLKHPRFVFSILKGYYL
ncbi:MAG: NAD(P)/FAD-dependent oxidoreductase [Thermoplasmatota archaeon]